MNNWKQVLLPFFLMFTGLLLDGFIAGAFMTYLNSDFGLIVPRLVFLILIILSFNYEQKFMYINGALIGLIMDAYYIGFIGVYTGSIFLIILIVSSLKKIVNPNVLSYSLVSVLGLTASELFIYGIMSVLGVTTSSFQMFLVSRLGATLLFNTIIMLIFSYFIHRTVTDLLDEREIR